MNNVLSVNVLSADKGACLTGEGSPVPSTSGRHAAPRTRGRHWLAPVYLCLTVVFRHWCFLLACCSRVKTSSFSRRAAGICKRGARRHDHEVTDVSALKCSGDVTGIFKILDGHCTFLVTSKRRASRSVQGLRITKFLHSQNQADELIFAIELIGDDIANAFVLHSPAFCSGTGTDGDEYQSGFRFK